jgi:hypothetical protein
VNGQFHDKPGNKQLHDLLVRGSLVASLEMVSYVTSIVMCNLMASVEMDSFMKVSNGM